MGSEMCIRDSFTGALSSAREGPTDEHVITVSARDATVDAGGHDVRPGRPDVHALVRAAAVEAGAQQHVVIAACGPASLVAAARNAVAACRKEVRGVRLEFAGSGARW